MVRTLRKTDVFWIAFAFAVTAGLTLFLEQSIKGQAPLSPSKGQYKRNAGQLWLVIDMASGQFYVCDHLLDQVKDAPVFHPYERPRTPRGCAVWDMARDFFPTQSVISVEAVNGSFLTTYNLISQGQQIADYVPYVKGGPGQPTTSPQGTILGQIAPALTTEEAGGVKPVNPCRNAYNTLADAINSFLAYSGIAEPLASDSCKYVPRSVTKTSLASVTVDALNFCAALKRCNRQQLSDANFNSLNDLAIKFIATQSFSDPNGETIILQNKFAELGKVESDYQAARSNWEKANTPSKCVVDENADTNQSDLAVLAEGEKQVSEVQRSIDASMPLYQECATTRKAAGFPAADKDMLANSVTNIVEQLNNIYEQNHPEPAPVVPFQQFSTNYIGKLTICKSEGFTRLSSDLKDPPAPNKANASGNSNDSAVNQVCKSPSTTQQPSGQSTKNAPSPKGKGAGPAGANQALPEQGQSSAGQEAATPDSQMSNAPTTDSTVAVVDQSAQAAEGGDQTPPPNPPPPGQLGTKDNPINLSVQLTTVTPNPKTSDVKADTLVARTGFQVHKTYRASLLAGFFVSGLKNRQYGLTNNGQATSPSNIINVVVTGPVTRPQYHAFTALNLYFKPHDAFPPAAQSRFGAQQFGVMVGYGVDQLNNYLVGLNWESKWGLSLSGGLHIGQETYLQPGVYPGVTQFPSTTTSPPTVSRVGYNGFGGVAFDLNTIKSAFASLFGGGGTKSQ